MNKNHLGKRIIQLLVIHKGYQDLDKYDHQNNSCLRLNNDFHLGKRHHEKVLALFFEIDNISYHEFYSRKF